MQHSDMVMLFDNMYCVNKRLLDAADHLAPDQFTASATATTRDLRATLVQELDVELSWLPRLQDRLEEGDAELKAENFPDAASLRERWKQDERDMRTWLDTLTDAHLDADVVSASTRNRRPLWQYLVHILTHAAQQQADAATLLTAAGHSPGEIGFLAYLHARDAKDAPT